VLGQRHLFSQGFEIVVVDDGSTDSTVEVLERYQMDQAVSVIRFDTNRGLGCARNAGFEQAAGQWCALLDSDNALLPNVAVNLESILVSMPEDIGVVWADGQDKEGTATITHGKCGRVLGLETFLQPLGGEHFSLIRTDVARGNLYPELGTRHACEPAFWAALGCATNFWIERQPLQYYDTTGADRFCALNTRLARAGELVACYRYTAGLVEEVAPQYHWELKGKAAFYRSVGGDWLGAVRESLGSVFGIRYSLQNLGIILACLAGPWFSRWLLRFLSRGI